MRKLELTDELRIKVLKAHQLGKVLMVSVDDSFILVVGNGQPQPNIPTGFAIKLIRAKTLQLVSGVDL